MLLRLEIRDFAVISNIVFEPSYGLNCISGETGAGKSLIVDAISLILGAKASKTLVRSNSPSCYVEACFDMTDLKNRKELDALLESQGITSEEDMLMISRQIYVNGKSIARINGISVTLQLLKDVASFLVDIHGQHDTQRIFDEKSHCTYLDSYGGEKIAKLHAKYTELLEEYKQIVLRIKGISSSPDFLERRREYLEFVVKEIGDAAFKEGEEEELIETRKKLQQNESTATVLSEVLSVLEGGDRSEGSSSHGAASDTAFAARELSRVASSDSSYTSLSARANAIALDLEALASDLSGLLDEMNYDPELRSKTEERIGLLYDLKGKYGKDIKEINEFCANSAKELSEIDANKDLLSELKTKRAEVEKKLLSCAEELSAARKTAGKKLSNSIVKELADLEMPNAVFEVEFVRREKTKFFSSSGIDDIAFKFSANPGQEARALSAIVSGGEASRIMLAIKNVLSMSDNTPTLIFDEIDTGVSGKASAAIAKKLKSIAEGHQVLCVTHTAQIAAAADCNFMLSKHVVSGNTVTECDLLDTDARVNEVSRLLSGGNGESSVKLAKELIQSFL
ncbi:MAG: DNA repair protein RecN [Clostridiales bacterium]|nr:DNA repair protein RecN [Clostridiales bacterium]